MESRKHRTITILRYAGAVLAVIFGIVLLVATKTGAGTAFVVAALFLALPLNHIASKYVIVKWIRAALVIILCASAIMNISNTDIPPDAHVTGIKFIDQMYSILRNFANTIMRNNQERRFSEIDTIDNDGLKKERFVWEVMVWKKMSGCYVLFVRVKFEHEYRRIQHTRTFLCFAQRASKKY